MIAANYHMMMRITTHSPYRAASSSRTGSVTVYGIDGEHLSTLEGACVVWVIRQLPALPLG